SLGFGPNDGLSMGTRCGSFDSSVVVTLPHQHNWCPEEVSNFLCKESGMKGLTGYSFILDIES
ncbi:acetate kinase, partial [Ornithobacterium rhinotracheale]